MRNKILISLIFAVGLFSGGFKTESYLFTGLKPRAIGPAVTSGRITAIDVVNSNPKIIYVGTAGGGVWKSDDGGVSFYPVFERYTMSIGSLTIDQKRPKTVWVGTGETNVRNTVSVGTGLYRTDDGGKNWEFVGFKDSERIAKIVIEPEDSKTVYVCVLGHLWDSNKERGLYKTTDGGKNWEKILYVDEKTGCADLEMDPQEPNILYAAMWQVRRWPYFFRSGGPGSGLYKTSDGGKKWVKLKRGLPEGELGRIELAIAPSRPSTIYAIVEAKKTGLYRSDDMGENWKRVNSSFFVSARPFYLANLYVSPKDHNRVYSPNFSLWVSDDGGKSFSQSSISSNFGISGGIHPDDHALWINPENPDNLILGTDGGIYVSYDRGNRFRFVGSLPVAQAYHVNYDMSYPYRVCTGLQDNGSWCGPSESISDRIRNKDWFPVGIGDGFYAFFDPESPEIVYSTWQGGKIERFNRKTWEAKDITPLPEKGEPEYRFNWNAAVALSPNDPEIIYIGSQFLLRTRNKGESWERISPDLTTNDPSKLKQDKSGGLTLDVSTAENYCTIYTISESPLDKDIIWVGTDDGNLQVTKDNGKTWENVVSNINGLPRGTWCSSVEASSHWKNTAYVTFDGHRTGDKRSYVFRTRDLGKTWESLATADIDGYCFKIKEDSVNPNLLFLGTEFGLYISIDGGKSWARFKNLPKVAVRDIAIHPREADLILATHGLGIQIIDDITPLRALNPDVLSKSAEVLPSRPVLKKAKAWIMEFLGDGQYSGPNPPNGAMINYYLKKRHIFGTLKLEVYDGKGKLIKTIPTTKHKGINRVYWDMRLKPPKNISFAFAFCGNSFRPNASRGNI